MPTRFQKARAFKHTRRQSTDITMNSTNWANVDTALDLVLAANVGDVLEAHLNLVCGNQTPDAYFDVATIVSSSPVNSFGKAGAVETAPSGTLGVPGWYCRGSAYDKAAGVAMYTVVAGDRDASGYVTLRLRYATSTATNRTLYASVYPILWGVKNLGPVDPN